MTLIITPGEKWPEPGSVIQCENGHDVAKVIAPSPGGDTIGAGVGFGSDAVPEVHMIEGDSIAHRVLPIRCRKCGGIAINWDQRFIGRSVESVAREQSCSN
jgi:hypothetical protein